MTSTTTTSRVLSNPRSYRLKNDLSPDFRRFVDYVWKTSNRSKEPGRILPQNFRPNEFELSMSQAANETRLPRTSCIRLRDVLIHANWLKATRLPGGKIAYSIPHESKRRTLKHAPVRKYESRSTKSLRKNPPLREKSSRSLTALETKSLSTLPDSPRHSPPIQTLPVPAYFALSSLKIAGKKIQEETTKRVKSTAPPKPAPTGLLEKHRAYFPTPFGLHEVAASARRDAGPLVWGWGELDAMVVRLAAFGAGLYDLPNLDRFATTNQRARKAVAKRAFEYYREAEGSTSERKQQVEARLKNDVLGNYQDFVERKRLGKISTPHATLVDVFERTAGEHRERKSWCVERGRQTMNESWATRDRAREEQRKREEIDRRQAEAMKQNDETRSALIRKLTFDRLKGLITQIELEQKLSAMGMKI